MVNPVAAATTAQQLPASDCQSRLKRAAQVVLQVAIRVLFIGTSILMASAILPLSFHAVVLPVVGLSSTLLSCFFFLSPNPISQRVVNHCPLLSPICGEQILPVGAPKGLNNRSQNCAFNSLVHFFEGDPRISQWLRDPVSAMNADQFMAFLAEYRPPAALIPDFRQYLANHPIQPTVYEQFLEFLEQYQPAQDGARQVQGIQETFKALGPFLDATAAFFANYDAPDGAADSQILREAVSDASAGVVSRSCRDQFDAPEAMTPIANLLPQSQKLHIREEYRFDTTGRVALPPHILNNQTVNNEDPGFIVLTIGDEPRLQQMLDLYLDSQEMIVKKGMDDQNREYPTVIQRRFTEVPASILIQLGRFKAVKPVQSWLNWALPTWFPPQEAVRMEKIETAVEIPEQITIRLADGTQSQYRLSSTVIHHGVFAGGHYTSTRAIGEHKYLVNDRSVSLLDEQDWTEQARAAYLLCYVPVADPQQG